MSADIAHCIEPPVECHKGCIFMMYFVETVLCAVWLDVTPKLRCRHAGKDIHRFGPCVTIGAATVQDTLPILVFVEVRALPVHMEHTTVPGYHGLVIVGTSRRRCFEHLEMHGSPERSQTSERELIIRLSCCVFRYHRCLCAMQ